MFSSIITLTCVWFFETCIHIDPAWLRVIVDLLAIVTIVGVMLCMSVN